MRCGNKQQHAVAGKNKLRSNEQIWPATSSNKQHQATTSSNNTLQHATPSALLRDSASQEIYPEFQTFKHSKQTHQFFKNAKEKEKCSSVTKSVELTATIRDWQHSWRSNCIPKPQRP